VSFATKVRNSLKALTSPKVDDRAFDPVTLDSAVLTTYGRFSLALERGQGCRVWDTDGRE
jgi:acetylornithine aminotransferase